MTTTILTPDDNLQAAFNVAQPGDLFLLRGGTYGQRFTLTRSGQAEASMITIRNYDDEPVTIVPSSRPQPYSSETCIVSQSASYNRIEGLTFTGGYNGLDIYAHHTWVLGCTLRNNYRQGLIATNHHIRIEQNLIEANGLIQANPALFHGVYFSNYYGLGVFEVAALNNTIRKHGGAGVHVWNSTYRTKRVFLLGNTFTENAWDVVLTNVDVAMASENRIVHGPYPISGAKTTAMFWLENSTSLDIVNNPQLDWTLQAPPVLGYLIQRSASQRLDQIHLSGNNWSVPGLNITDATALLWSQTP